MQRAAMPLIWVAAVISLAACTSTPSAPVPVPSAPTAVVTAAPATQLDWHTCTAEELAGFQCGRLTVPKDYDEPGNGSFELAVVKLPATGKPDDRLGTLFFNPGGPGVAAIDVAPAVSSALGSQLRNRFDFVVWDPRGVGGSSPLQNCLAGSYALPATGVVSWATVASQMRASEAAANRACQQANAQVMPYIGTNNTVRDLETLREAVGDEKLTYWGTSYGTRIGYAYAARYPDRVRAMLLSSPVSPNGTWLDFATTAATAPDDSIGLLFQADPSALTHYRTALAGLEIQPLRLPSGREFTRWHLQAWLNLQSASDSHLPAAADFLTQADQAINGHGAAQQRAAAAVDAVMEWPQTFPINGGATAAINCLDFDGRLSAAEQDQAMAKNRLRAPISGWLASMALVYCEGLDLTADPVPSVDDWSTPILILASTRDGLTPYSFAVDLARAFHKSRLVSLVGGTHTPFLSAGSACMDRIGTEYLIKGTLPPVDTACPPVAALAGTAGE